MLKNIDPHTYHVKAKSELEDVRHHLKLLHKIEQELDSLDQFTHRPQRQVIMDKSDKLKASIRDKLKSMALNVNQIAAVLDHKIHILTNQLTKLYNMYQSPPTPTPTSKPTPSPQLQHQINQLEERIFELQKKQNEYVKQISQLKQKNAKLRDQFTNLSFDSNQRIKQLSEKLHNNTSPNLSIKRINPNSINDHDHLPLPNFSDNDKKKSKNNFVKIMGGNNFQNQFNHLEISPIQAKKHKNLLESMTSESSDYDIKPLAMEFADNQLNSSGNLKFGCFPAKQVSQKTKTGSSSENKKISTEQKHDKSRRFEFLLNNLMDKKPPQEDNPITIPPPNQTINTSSSNLYTTSYKPPLNPQPRTYQYKPLGTSPNPEEYKSVFNENLVKRYQI